jgi:hypothetical protein
VLGEGGEAPEPSSL